MARYQPGEAPRLVLKHLRAEGETWVRELPGYKSEPQMEQTLKPLRERWKLIRAGSGLKTSGVPGGEGWDSVELTEAGETVADELNAGKQSFKL
jgi:hypothetical protein